MMDRHMREKQEMVVVSKCRRCDATVRGAVARYSAMNTALIGLTCSESYRSPVTGHVLTRLDVHECSDGGLGIADIIGAEAKE